MAILDPNEIFFTAFEPKQQNRFLMLVDGVPSYFIKGVGAISLTQGEVTLNHINVYRKVKGKTTWGNVQLTLHDPVSPSGTQTIMEWVRLHHESVTGRDGYSDFYKKDLTLQTLGPVGDTVSEWVIKGASIVSADFGQFDWSTDTRLEIAVTVQMDYCILNF